MPCAHRHIEDLNQQLKANVEKSAMRIVACRLLVEPLQQAWHEAAATMAPAG